MSVGPTAPGPNKDNDEPTDSDEVFVFSVPWTKTQKSLESFEIPLSFNSAYSSDSSTEILFSPKGKALNESSKVIWTDEQIEETIKQMNEQRRDLMIEQETSKVRMELTKMQKSNDLLHEKVGSTKNVIENFKKEKRNRNNEIAQLRRDMMVLKKQWAANKENCIKSTGDREFSNPIGRSKSYRFSRDLKTSNMSDLTSLFVRCDARKSAEPHVPNNLRISARQSKRSQTDRSVQSMVSDSFSNGIFGGWETDESKEPEIVGLKMKIAALEQENRNGEGKIKNLESQVNKLSSTVKTLITSLSQRAKSFQDMALVMDQNDMRRGRDSSSCLNGEKEHSEGFESFRSSVIPGTGQSLVLGQSDYKMDQFAGAVFPDENESTSVEGVLDFTPAIQYNQGVTRLDFETFTDFEAADIEGGPVSFVL